MPVNYKKAIINGLIFTGNEFEKGTILIKNNKIESVILDNISTDAWIKAGYNILDATDCIISYGFFDPHVHLRCPGSSQKEDWISGVKAAIAGGFTFIADMPNNNPPATDFDILNLKSTLQKSYPINYGLYIGATDANATELKKIIAKCRKKNIPILGIKCFLGSSTGDLLLKNDESIYEALKTGEIVLFHAENEPTLKKTANIPYQTIQDHNIIRPAEAEADAIERIAQIATPIKDKARIYICHISSMLGFKKLKEYKKQGYTMISEVTPHHLFFSLSNITDDTIYKVNPPIRSEKDVAYLRGKFNKGKITRG